MSREQKPLGFAEAESSYDDRLKFVLLALMRARADLHLHRFLMLVFDATHGGAAGETLKRSYEQLAASERYGMWCSTAKARTTVAKAVGYGWVRVNETRSACGSQSPNEYAIDWDGIKGSLDMGRRVGTSRDATVADALLEQGPASTAQGLALTEQGPASTAHHTKELNTLFKNSLPNTLPSDAQTPAPGPATTEEEQEKSEIGIRKSERTEEGWREAIAALRRCGVKAARLACEAARKGGARAGDVAGLVAHFERSPGRWAAGVLYRRVCEATADGDPGEGWPERASEVAEVEGARLREVRREASARTTAEFVRSQEAQRSTVAAERAEAERLEERHGAAIDRATSAELVALLERTGRGKVAALLGRTGRDSPTIRPVLLEAADAAGLGAGGSGLGEEACIAGRS